MRILIAEDDASLLKSLIYVFKLNKYEVDGVSNGLDAYDYASSGEYDGLVLDIMMPSLDGISVLKKLRAQGINTPTLFLTAKTEISDRVEGLDAGADDYISKPFSTQELLARVRAMLRRKDNFVPEIMEYEGLKLNKSTYELSYLNNVVTLGSKELQITEVLFSRKGNIVTIEQLITHIWGWDTDIDTSVVWVHISNLRKKMESINAPVTVKFIRNAGYVLEKIK
ncbi:MAG TPA: DNA-binding response regulator [Clostridiales bacterium]|nr:DNA-binding response regulator [Clostridiales bacterium]